jgi:hypothetical protein
MKKTILSFFAGICLVILTAAATGVTEFKPASPKNTVVITGDSEHCKQSIISYAKQGFQVKSSAGVSYGSATFLIVMEKY